MLGLLLSHEASGLALWERLGDGFGCRFRLTSGRLLGQLFGRLLSWLLPGAALAPRRSADEGLLGWVMGFGCRRSRDVSLKDGVEMRGKFMATRIDVD